MELNSYEEERTTLTMLLQPINASGEDCYLVYIAPDGEEKGRFRQEEGGIVWISDNFPEGAPCQTLLVAKATGEVAMEFLRAKMAEMHITRRERR